MTLPSATTTITSTAVAPATGTDLIAVIAPVTTNADATPRVFANAAAVVALHGYNEGAEYVALHVRETRKPVLFVGIPIATPGAVSRKNVSGNSGTSVVDVAAGGSGTLAEVDGVVTVITGGTVGTDQIVIGVSLDGGRTTKRVRLGTANSYAIPSVGMTLSFAAGTLVAGDTALTWASSAPRGNQSGLEDAREALAAQQKQVRSWLIIGDLQSSSDADNVVTEVNAYETASDRYVYARCGVRDRLPAAAMSRITVRMTGSPTVTFAEVGATGDTITRSSGSFVTDGFVAGDRITTTGSVSNNFAGALITGVTALVLTLDTQDLVAEGPVADVTITGSPGLTFTEVGATGDTLTRSRGSWLTDGFRVGDTLGISGTSSNNFTDGDVTAVTATVITFGTRDLTAEGVRSDAVTVTSGQTKAAWIAEQDAEYASVDDEPRIDLGAGRARKMSPLIGYELRRSVSWAASIREYQHDVHIPCWRKDDGSLSGWDLEDDNGELVEFDERVDGGALAGRFTCFRTWANGPTGTFIAQSLTRADDSSILSRTHNVAVANVAQTVCQAATESAIGQVLLLNDDGTAKQESLLLLESRVDGELAVALLQDRGEGARASGASWTASRDDVLNVPDAVLTGVLELTLNGTVEHIATSVRVQ